MKNLIPLFISFLSFFASGQTRSINSLAGQWRFELDSLDIGEQQKWFNKQLKSTIQLPGITDEGGYGNEVIEMGKLSRLHKYIGKAWYQKDIVIPENWKEKNIDLYLERVMWQSKLWLDGEYVDLQESLSTPHLYSLGKLSPGIHTLTLSIDNREIYSIGNIWGHSYGDQTQIIWNGIIGKIELSVYPDIYLKQIRTFPDENGKLDIEISIRNKKTKKIKSSLSLDIKEKATGKLVQSETFRFDINQEYETIKKTLLIPNPHLWDEFSPQLYVLESTFNTKYGKDSYEPITFGFRTIDRTEDYVTINGIPRYLRGNLDCAQFPLTGYPPTDKESWLHIFKIYKDYGFNHVRFHSWTPPAAAFEAADEVGLYVLSEIFWRDGWMGKGLDVDSVAPFLRPELKRIADTYGNHPSLVMLAMGNELGGFDRNLMDPWIKEVKEHDSRHFYAASVRRPATEHTDINFHGDLSSPYPLLYINQGKMSTDWDYAQWYGKASPLPSIQHEVGQWVFYPNWNEVEKYTGILRSHDMENYRKLAYQRGVYEQNEEFILSSGKQSINLYKENIESFLRTPLCGGFQLLSMQDFSGQGVALIGWLDSFYDNKGIVKPEDVREWCNTTVPLMRAPSYTYTNRDTLHVALEILHFSKENIPNATIQWQLVSESGKILKKNSFTNYTIRNATLNEIGKLTIPLTNINQAEKITLTVSIEGTPFKNKWNFWVFPPEDIPTPGNIIETTSLTEAIDRLKKGETVFLWAHGLGTNVNGGYAQWKPTFWQGGNLGNEGFVNGAVIRDKHPAFNSFPTDKYLDFQWFDICNGSRGFDLEGLPYSIRPIVQPIHDFHFNRKLGSIMEFYSEEGGKILICGYNLIDSLDNRPAALALRNSLMQYVSSPSFQPIDIIDYSWMKRQLQDISKPYIAPAEFENAYLYVKAGGKSDKNGIYDWSTDKDATTEYETDKYGYNLLKGNIFVHESFSVWQGQEMQLDLKLPFHFNGKIHIKLSNPYNRIAGAKILFNGNEYIMDSIPQEGEWISLQMKEGEALLGQISIIFNSLSSQALMIEEIAITPH